MSVGRQTKIVSEPTLVTVELDILRIVTSRLDEAAIAYMLTGAMATGLRSDDRTSAAFSSLSSNSGENKPSASNELLAAWLLRRPL